MLKMGMEPKEIEVCLSRDIIQGEEVPFYILWKRNDIQRITLELNGFENITEYHNVEDDFSLEKHTIELKDLKSSHYLGGVLRTDETENPYEKAALKVIFELSNGDNIEINEERTLYTTHLEIISPDYIEVPFNEPPIEIQLKGSTTVFVNIESTSDSDIEIILPEEIRNAFDEMYQSLTKGINSLKNEYPEFSSEIDILIRFFFEDETYRLSKQEYFRRFAEIAEIFRSNRALLEGFGVVFINSVLMQGSARDLFFTPLLEYFESNAAKKVFLESPFLFAEIPKGGGYLRASVYYEDIIERIDMIKNIIEKPCSVRDFVEKLRSEPQRKKLCLEVFLRSENETKIPIRDLISMRRIF